jgi:hypothetical protein
MQACLTLSPEINQEKHLSDNYAFFDFSYAEVASNGPFQKSAQLVVEEGVVSPH